MSIVRATENVWVSPTRLVKAGELFDSDDPIVKTRAGLFVDAVPGGIVESATAAPGEKRARRPRKATPQADQD